CASTASTSPGGSPASARAARMTRCCASSFGAVNPLDAPSWLTAEPRITAQIRRPWRRASDNRSSTSTPAPSPQPVPSAASANDLHRPSADSPRCRAPSTNSPGAGSADTPPANANVHSPERRDRTAWWTATSDDEHAVSVDTAGPSRPSTYATRPEATLVYVP